MTTKHDGLADLPLRDLCRALAARTPTPSGGSLAAAAGALGAAGVSMTLRYAEGEGAAWQRGRADELEALALALCDLVERDAAVYGRVAAAREIPGDEARGAALRKAFRAALDTPLEMIEACLGALRITAAGAPEGVTRHLACDCLAGAETLRAALESAFLMVQENAGLAGDPGEAAEILAAARALRAEADAALERVRAVAAEPAR